jgi:hypothetical protein
MMKNLKIKLAALALILGVSGAFATMKPRHFDARKWSRNAASGAYTDITGEQLGQDYNCQFSSAVCTATYPAGQDPNTKSDTPLSVENGIFN